MNKNVVVYNVSYEQSIAAAGGTDNPFFLIREVGRWFNLSKIIYTLGLFETVSQHPVPLAVNYAMQYAWWIYDAADVNGYVGKPPTQFTNGLGACGAQMGFFQPGVYTFQNLRFYEQFQLRNLFTNTDPGLAINIRFGIQIELEFFEPQE